MKNLKYSLAFWALLILALVGVCSILAGAINPAEKIAEERENERKIFNAVVCELEDMKEQIQQKTAVEKEAARVVRKTVNVYLGRYWITGYDACVKCCGKTDGVTASGAIADTSRTIAAGKEFDFGTILYIDGIGQRTVEDRGGAVRRGRIDVFCKNHSDCYALTGWRDVYKVVEVEE